MHPIFFIQLKMQIYLHQGEIPAFCPLKMVQSYDRVGFLFFLWCRRWSFLRYNW